MELENGVCEHEAFRLGIGDPSTHFHLGGLVARLSYVEVSGLGILPLAIVALEYHEQGGHQPQQGP